MKRTRRLPKGRAQLVQVLSAVKGVIQIDNVVSSLGLDRRAAAQRLSRWLEQGWLKRVGRGSYVALSVDMLGSDEVLEDPWILVPALFAPAYIGGRTAAEHWGLIERASSNIVVLTGRPLRETLQEREGASFVLKHLDKQKIFGFEKVSRHQTLVPVSDIHRTMVDMLDDPALGRGIRHVSECLATYMQRKDRDEKRLIDYALRLGNRAVFKRLGFLAEHLGVSESLVKSCGSHLSGGYALLDPGRQNPTAIPKWRLRVPRRWGP